MKSSILLFVLLCTLLSPTSHAFAFGWFNVNAAVQITPVGVQVSIINTFPAPIQCRGMVYGMNNFGQTGRFDFFIASIGLGTYGYAYIETYNSVLVQAQAQAQCQLIHPIATPLPMPRPMPMPVAPIFYPY